VRGKLSNNNEINKKAGTKRSGSKFLFKKLISVYAQKFDTHYFQLFPVKAAIS
jgi:hypothetical protein